jgi:hypothetical protein
MMALRRQTLANGQATGQSLLVGGAAANRRKGESGNTDDPLPDREPGRRGRPWRCVGSGCGNPGAPPGRHCHAETTHDTCSRRGATWRSGDAADCKSAHPGSIPGVASQGRSYPQKCRPGLPEGCATRRSIGPYKCAQSGCSIRNRCATRASSLGTAAYWTHGRGSERRVRLLRPRE